MLQTKGEGQVTRAKATNVSRIVWQNSPPRRRSAAALWSKRIARSSPCRSSPSQCRAPLGTALTTDPCAPGCQSSEMEEDPLERLKVCGSKSVFVCGKTIT